MFDDKFSLVEIRFAVAAGAADFFWGGEKMECKTAAEPLDDDTAAAVVR